MSNRRWWGAVSGLAVAALAIRVVWVIWAAREPVGLVDPARYLSYARQIADGHGMVDVLTGQPTAYYPPGYPWFLGLVAWAARPFTDDVALAGGLVQGTLGALTAVLGALVGRRLAGQWAGIAAAAGLALYPNLVFHSAALLGETFYNFLFMAFLAAILVRPWKDSRATRWIAGSGILLGLAVLVRPVSLAVLPVAFLALWLAHGGGRSVARWCILLTLGVVACIVPWTVRNQVRLGHAVAISTNAGDNLCIGHGPGATGTFTLRRQACDVEPNFLDGPDGEVAANSAKIRAGLRGIGERPGREPWLLWSRFYYTWVRDGDHDAVQAVQSYRLDRWMAPTTETRLVRLADVAYWFTAVLGLAGLVGLVGRRRPDDVLVVGSAVMTALVPLAFFGDSRFKVPVIPLLIVIAAAGVSHGFQTRRRRP